jgi:hypothetical protein
MLHLWLANKTLGLLVGGILSLVQVFSCHANWLLRI